MRTTIRGLIGTSVAALLALVFIPTTVNAQQQQQQEQQTDQCEVTVRSDSGQQGQQMTRQQRQEQGQQEQARRQQQETPTVQPGQTAVALQVQLSGNLSQISDFSADQNSGLELASEDDLGRVDMARTEEEGQTMQPISNEGGQTATVWINTENAEAGTYQVSFRGANAKCDTQIKVSEDQGGR